MAGAPCNVIYDTRKITIQRLFPQLQGKAASGPNQSQKKLSSRLALLSEKTLISQKILKYSTKSGQLSGHFRKFLQFLGKLKTHLKVSVQSGNFLYTQESLQILWKVSIISGMFPDVLESFGTQVIL